MSNHSENKTRRELARITVSNPRLMAAMQETAESYAELKDVIHTKIALTLPRSCAHDMYTAIPTTGMSVVDDDC